MWVRGVVFLGARHPDYLWILSFSRRLRVDKEDEMSKMITRRGDGSQVVFGNMFMWLIGCFLAWIAIGWVAKPWIKQLSLAAWKAVAAITMAVIITITIAGCASQIAQYRAVVTNDVRTHCIRTDSLDILGVPVLGGTKTYASDKTGEPCPTTVKESVSYGNGYNYGNNSYYGTYSTGPSYDAWAGRGSLPVNPPSFPGQSQQQWLDPQGPEYRAWACRQYGSFNGIPCR
ncbi:MAG: hypothetical protein NTW60_00560 [Candidatus Wolfebacteria bacterium]|nr:hypothetical protein [Candidatus Wolfebacteria bacterium]